MSKKYEQDVSSVKKSRSKSGFDTEFKHEPRYRHLFGKHRSSNKLLLDNQEEQKWLKCAATPMNEFCRPVVTPNGSIIVSPYNQTHLLIYDDNKQIWKKLIKYPSNMSKNISHHTISLDSKNKRLYLFDGNFVEFDLNTKLTRTYGKIANVGKSPVSVWMDGELHVIGLFCCVLHKI